MGSVLFLLPDRKRKGLCPNPGSGFLLRAFFRPETRLRADLYFFQSAKLEEGRGVEKDRRSEFSTGLSDRDGNRTCFPCHVFRSGKLCPGNGIRTSLILLPRLLLSLQNCAGRWPYGRQDSFGRFRHICMENKRFPAGFLFCRVRKIMKHEDSLRFSRSGSTIFGNGQRPLREIPACQGNV